MRYSVENFETHGKRFKIVTKPAPDGLQGIWFFDVTGEEFARFAVAVPIDRAEDTVEWFKKLVAE